jgi:hypothetical protein
LKPRNDGTIRYDRQLRCQAFWLIGVEAIP